MSDIHPMRTWRKKAGKTLADVAGEAGVQPSTLSYIERFEKQPSLSLAAKLSELSGIPMDQFVRQEAVA